MDDLVKLYNECHRRFSYDPDTGIVTYKVWSNGLPKDCIGKPVGTPSKQSGYLDARVFGTKYRLHRLIWLMQTGEMPEEIDHDNRIRHDNRWDNLKNGDHRSNMQNIENYSGNISYNAKSSTYTLRLYYNKKHYHIMASKERKDLEGILDQVLSELKQGIDIQEIKRKYAQR